MLKHSIAANHFLESRVSGDKAEEDHLVKAQALVSKGPLAACSELLLSTITLYLIMHLGSFNY